MTWHWRFADGAGVAVDGPLVAFETQQAAESWLTQEYPDLADQGIAEVSLFDGDRAVYGPMSLEPG